MMNRRTPYSAALVLLALGLLMSAADADVKLPRIFGSHMVLQREMKLPVWGWAEPAEKVTVQLGDGAPVSAVANDKGEWKLSLPPVAAGGPFTMKVTGKNAITLDDVLVGEVWLCSGQSNMEMQVVSVNNATQEIADAKYPRIRAIKAPHTPAGFPATDYDASWVICSPETAGGFTAAGFFFAREVQKALDVPIGLLDSSWGGTAIEPWTPPVGFAQVPSLKSFYDRVMLTDPKSATYKAMLGDYIARNEAWQTQAKAALAGEKPLDPAPAYPNELKPMVGVGDPAALFNGLVSPIIPYAIRGALWYQGETNHWDGMLYADKTKALVAGWRQLWGEGDFPYYYVQIAPYNYGNEDPYVLARFWEAQLACQAIPNTGMARTNDIGDINDIHPKNKQEVGRRLALWALAKTYGKTDVVCEGPTFKEMSQEPGALRVRFANVGSGLVSRDGKPLNWFEIIGQDTDFVKADARIDGDSVVLTSPEVKQPVAMRFGWHRNAEMNLSNKEGLPAYPCHAGEVPKRDWLALKVPEAKDYQLVYDLDLAKANPLVYDVDNHANVTGNFDRIAYFLELQQGDQGVQYVYVSMDAFTKDLGKIGVPTLASGAKFQQLVANLNVVSNVTGIVTGEGLKGNLEFWPNNYGPANAANVPNADAAKWDFGDEMSGPEDGYGSMQVGNYEAKQTIFAFNSWKSGDGADVGIGNSDGDTRDWTFKRNSASYQVRRLRVLVRVK